VGERFHPVVLSAFYGIPFVSSDYYSRSGPAALLNGRSKTRDFCKRIGALADVIPSDSFFSKRDPKAVLQRLSEERSVDVSACRSVFQNALTVALEK
jgi:polysaccharide pyruvyl transferase WcaK-like protein